MAADKTESSGNQRVPHPILRVSAEAMDRRWMPPLRESVHNFVKGATAGRAIPIRDNTAADLPITLADTSASLSQPPTLRAPMNGPIPGSVSRTQRARLTNRGPTGSVD